MILNKVGEVAKGNAGNIEGFRNAMRELGLFLKANPGLLYR